MAGVSFRTTSMLSSNQMLSSLRRTQSSLASINQAIGTGVQVNRPSDAPASTSAILALQQRLEARVQYSVNFQFAETILNNTDQSLSDAGDILLEIQSIGSSQVGIGSTADTRLNQASVIDQQIQSLLDIANRRVQDVSLFGGTNTPPDNQNGGDVFIDFLGGYRYIGTRENLKTDVGLRQPLEYNSNGDEAFGALSARVKGSIDLNPTATNDTRLADLEGALGRGVASGSLRLVINGSPSTINLDNAHTLGDVITRVNDAINTASPGAGSLAFSGGGLALTAAAGNTLEISDIGAATTAADLGIVLTASSATVAGADLNPKITALTSLASLGTTIDWTSGLKITQGDQTRIADFSAATTVQDLANVIDNLRLGLRLEISEDQSALNLVSDVSGLELSVGENAGGTTAGDLGLRTFGLSTRLADFNHGLGVGNSVGADDFAIQLHDGSSFNVNIDSVTTVGELLTAIRNAATAAGLTVGDPGDVGTHFNVGLAPDGNGMALENGSLAAGGSAFRVTQLGTSLAATDLGIYHNAQTGNAINGEDRAKVRVESVFTHLIALRDALVSNDSTGITVATSHIENDVSKLTRIRGEVGVRTQRVIQQQERSEEMQIAEESMLDQLRGADLTEVITRFSQLQQQLEASLRAGSQNLQMSFLEFLS